MKIKINIKNLKKLLASGLIVLCIGPLAACSKNTNDKKYNSDANNTYSEGTHNLVQVKRGLTIIGKEGTFRLKAPEGYQVLDYDYDYVPPYEYNDYFYTNTEEVICSDPNKFGIPKKESEEKEICGIGEHAIIDIDRSPTLMGRFSYTKDLTAPAGYNVVDYDYDTGDGFEFESVTYRNNEPVKLHNENDFGEPVEKEEKEEKDYYDVGEHFIVTLNRNVNPLLGKNETMTITAPKGYEILDYDYDKLDYTEYETILYRNIVPVTKVKNSFGEALVEPDCIDEALVEIDRDLNMIIGFNKLQQAKEKDGYVVIDYDYDKTENFEFETYVYKKKR